VAYPTCTIFIPAYNAEQTIEAVIERIPKDHWESLCGVLVNNDGSADDTSGRAARRREILVVFTSSR
jgi:glycosyltransferase involved in cell wall biosynthesis